MADTNRGAGLEDAAKLTAVQCGEQVIEQAREEFVRAVESGEEPSDTAQVVLATVAAVRAPRGAELFYGDSAHRAVRDDAT